MKATIKIQSMEITISDSTISSKDLLAGLLGMTATGILAAAIGKASAKTGSPVNLQEKIDSIKRKRKNPDS